jgi:hypothetical protein
MKLILSKLLYYFGDLISKLFYYSFFRRGARILYPIYSKLMICSMDLDKDGKLWKEVKKKNT